LLFVALVELEANTWPVTKVKAIKKWLEPEDPVLNNTTEFTAHFAQEREESTCLWMAPYLTRFLKSDQKTMFISGKPGSGKTILASVINDYLQYPIGGVMYKSIFVPISESIQPFEWVMFFTR
jgi:DNA replication protein DnaC